MKNWTILIFLLLISKISFASTSACQEKVLSFKNFTVHTSLRSSGHCLLAIANRNTSGLIYRDYLFTSEGQLMVFNSYGYGSTKTDTGARVFYFAPEINELSFDISGDELSIYLVNGSIVKFNLETGKFLNIDSGTIRLDDKISRDNEGGFEIENYPGIYFDLGFNMGNSPVIIKNRNVKIQSPKAQCLVRMSKIFKYSGDDAYFELRIPQDYQQFLERNCPNI